MPTLYVENVPDELYEGLRARARQHRKSIAAEVLTLLEENIPTAKELAQRKKLLQRVRKLRTRRSGSSGRFPTSEEIQRSAAQYLGRDVNVIIVAIKKSLRFVAE